jgi:hypothetical protein
MKKYVPLENVQTPRSDVVLIIKQWDVLEFGVSSNPKPDPS